MPRIRVPISVHNCSMADLELDHIGKYELITEIGAGSMGRVFHARDPFTQQDVAIKFAEDRESDSERGQRRPRLRPETVQKI